MWNLRDSPEGSGGMPEQEAARFFPDNERFCILRGDGGLERRTQMN